MLSVPRMSSRYNKHTHVCIQYMLPCRSNTTHLVGYWIVNPKAAGSSPSSGHWCSIVYIAKFPHSLFQEQLANTGLQVFPSNIVVIPCSHYRRGSNPIQSFTNRFIFHLTQKHRTGSTVRQTYFSWLQGVKITSQYLHDNNSNYY